MKRFLITITILLILPSAVFAAEENYSTYIESFDLSSFDELDDATTDFLESLGVLDFDYENLTNISIKDVFNHIINIVMMKMDGPLKSGLIVMVLIMLSSFFKSFNSELTSSSISSTYQTITTLIISIFLVYKLTDCIAMSCSTIQLCANFAFAFFPAFCVIVATSGSTMTSFSVNTTLLILSQGINYIAELIFIPLINCFLALGICSGIRQELNLNSAISMLKKLITGAVSTISAVFVSILSIKTSVASKADALGLRSVRFAINSVVPVIGSSISEGLLSIQSYSSLIKTSVGIVGILAVAVIFLPALIEVNMWRIVLSLAGMCCDLFTDGQSSKSIDTFKDTLLIIDVLLILTMVTTIISIGILVAAKTAV